MKDGESIVNLCGGTLTFLDTLFEWARQFGPETSWEEFARTARSALDWLPASGPLRYELTRGLQTGQVDWRRVRSWPDVYRHMRSDQDLLLEELYEYSRGLPVSRCKTGRFRRFERNLDRPEMLAKIRAEIESTWETYTSQPLAPGEYTAETVVGHRLLVEGLALWLEV